MAANSTALPTLVQRPSTRASESNAAEHGGVICKIAETREEREAAFRLLYEAYVRTGLSRENPHRLRVTPYHLLPSTEVFVAIAYGPKTRGEVISTLTLVTDGADGLPMDCAYAREVQQRRERGLLLAEMTCLTDRRRRLRRFFAVFCQLARLAGQYARRNGVDQLLAAVHPKHARFYIRNCAFEMVGGPKAYPNVRNRPAVALCLDFLRAQQEEPETYDRFLGRPLPADQLQPKPMSSDDRQHFQRLVDPEFQSIPLGDTATVGPLQPARECRARPR